MIENSLFLVSTPLHLMVSIAIVDTLQVKNAHLVFIDQVAGRKNPYLQTLENWPQNPFKSVAVFYRPERRLISKLKTRRETFAALGRIVNTLRPAQVYTGNDRRIEFQYCMHKATVLGLQPKGNYMDEGTFTYVGRKASSSFADKVLDNAMKKIAYGPWWQHPETVGASAWIDTIYVSFPGIVHPLLRAKKTVQLTLAFWQSAKLVEFCSRLVDQIGRPENLARLEMLVTLPHESIIEASPNYKNQIKAIIEQQIALGLNVGVKYHPRDTNADALGLASIPGVEILSRELPFEALLPMIKPGAIVLGDFSTTLISTRLLRPDLQARAIDHGGNANAEDFIGLYRKIGVEIIKNESK